MSILRTDPFSLPNTAYITNAFDADARLIATYLKNSGNTVLDSYLYTYNPANQRTNLTRADTNSVAFSYDRIGQLTIADSSVNAEDRGYTYDSAWNLNYRTNNGVLGTFAVDGKNELTNSPGGSPVYNGNGDLIELHDGSFDSAGYDAEEDRLVWIQLDTQWRSEFAYDGLGRLRVRTNYLWNAMSGTWISNNVVNYVYDGWRVIQERDGSNVPTVSYTRGNDLSGSMEGAGGIGGLLARSDGYSAGNWTSHAHYFADGNGNVTYMTDGSQSMVASYRYDPFGNTISSSGTLASANVYRFSSKEFLVNSGMYYFGYRFYDPSLQRWINRDPIEERGGVNLYAFVGNDGCGRIDPWGMGEWTLSIEKDDQSPWYHPNPLVTAKYLLGNHQAKCCSTYRIKRFARPHAIGAFGTLNWRFDGYGEIIGSTLFRDHAVAFDQPGAKLPVIGLVYPYVIDFRWEVYCYENFKEGEKLSEIEETIVILGNTASWVGYGPDQTTIHISDGD